MVSTIGLLCEFSCVDDKGYALGTVGIPVAFEVVLVVLLTPGDNDDTFVIEFAWMGSMILSFDSLLYKLLCEGICGVLAILHL